MEGKIFHWFLGEGLEGEGVEGKKFHWFLGNGLEGEGLEGKFFHWFLGNGLEGEGVEGKMLNGFLGKGLEGKGRIHPPSPLRGRGAIRRDEATKKQRYALLFCRLASCQVA